jgi:uncharacterized membrane protein
MLSDASIKGTDSGHVAWPENIAIVKQLICIDFLINFYIVANISEKYALNRNKS